MSPANPARLERRLADPTAAVGFKPRAVVPVINRKQDDTRTLQEALAAEQAQFEEWVRT